MVEGFDSHFDETYRKECDLVIFKRVMFLILASAILGSILTKLTERGLGVLFRMAKLIFRELRSTNLQNNLEVPLYILRKQNLYFINSVHFRR